MLSLNDFGVALAGVLLTGATACSSTAALQPPAGPLATQPCGASDIDVSTGSELSDGGTHRGVRLEFGLTGDADSCLLTGYPGVYTSAGGPPQAHASSTPRGYLGGLPAGADDLPTVLVTIGRPAHAVLETTVNGDSGQPCPTYDGLVVNPPHTTSIVLIAVPIQGCQFEVHPVTDDGPGSAGG